MAYINLGLIGKPLSHTLSPKIHTSFLYKSRLNGGYNAFEVAAAERLPFILNFFKEYNFRGFNITVPYKEDIIPLLDSLHPDAEEIEAVNTVLIKEGRSIGYNTDIYGFRKTLEEAGVELKDKTVLVLGCGGAAKAVFKVIKDAEPKSVTVVNRTAEKCEKIKKLLKFDNFFIYDYNFIGQKQQFDVIINTTSIGLDGSTFPVMANLTCFDAAVDIQYKKEGLTPFLSAFEDRTNILADGLGMLIHQAHEAFRIWTDISVEIDPDLFSQELNS